MNLKDYIATKTFGGKIPGFSEGDTLIKINDVSGEDFSFEDEKGKTIIKTKLIFKDGKEYYCPDSVMRQIEDLMTLGFTVFRVTRTGTSFEKTKYTVIGIKEEA